MCHQLGRWLNEPCLQILGLVKQTLLYKLTFLHRGTITCNPKATATVKPVKQSKAVQYFHQATSAVTWFILKAPYIDIVSDTVIPGNNWEVSSKLTVTSVMGR